MNLIIVSQDKENIVKFNSNIGLHWQDKRMIVANYIDLGNGEYYELLGKYETKERAKEVLSEIKKLLNPLSVFKNCEIDKETFLQAKKFGAILLSEPATMEKIEDYVYDMPEE